MNERLATLGRRLDALPPHTFFAVSAVFHYLGPSFAVLLFPAVGVLGVAWLRIATAALVFAPISRPWRTIRKADRRTRFVLLGLGICLAGMNSAFYLALDRLPMSLVAAIEFVGTIAVALYGMRTARNGVALILSVVGVFVLIDVSWSSDGIGLAWAVLNGILFVGYIMLGHRIARGGGDGIQRLGAAMAIALVCVMPFGLIEAVAAFRSPVLVLAGIAVGLCSSVIPYTCDQLAMARLPQATFALMLAILPATATLTAAIVLAQIPTVSDLFGIALVMTAIAVHRPATGQAYGADPSVAAPLEARDACEGNGQVRRTGRSA